MQQRRNFVGCDCTITCVWFCQILDAPDLKDDFYMNLMDWSSTNVLAIGLGTVVYLWSASSGKVGGEPAKNKQMHISFLTRRCGFNRLNISLESTSSILFCSTHNETPQLALEH